MMPRSTAGARAALLPDGAAQYPKRRVAELAGLGVFAVAGLLCAALATYDPADPSFNVATTSPVHNVLDLPGAAVADLLLQTIGLGAAVIVLVMVTLAWQIATGRWVVQHHHVPSVDVLSYTAQGQPWVYPVGAMVVFYLAWLAGGYGLLSWFGAAACVGTVALLLRRGNPASASIAIVAVPLIAGRTGVRADAFSTVLFAALITSWSRVIRDHGPIWITACGSL